MLNKSRIFLLFIVFLCYLSYGTGIHSDEIIHTIYVSSWSFEQLLILNYFESPLLYMFYNLPVYYLDFFQYYFFGENEIFYEAMKVLVLCFSAYMLYFFARDYLSEQKALLLAGIFVLFPLHDSVTYLLQISQYILITFGLIACSHSLINSNKMKTGIFIGFMGSFFSYASPPFVWGLSVIFLIKKEYRKFFFFVLPQIIYILYVIILSKFLKLESLRAVDISNIQNLFKQFIMQILSFIDVAVGPSFWLKLFYSITEISLLSMLVGIPIVFLLNKYYRFDKEKFNWHLFYAFLSVAVLSFCMFATTGHYPQTAFNLGNRVVIYSSMLLVLLVVSLMNINKIINIVIISILTFSMLGISDHWKSWNKKQKLIAHNFVHNQAISTFDNSNKLFVSHNQFSKLGTISHIEYFTEGAGIIHLTKEMNRDINYSTLNKRFYLDDNKLIDRKWGTQFTVGDHIYVYDSEADNLLKIGKSEIQGYIDALPPDHRHWIQMINNEYVNSMIIKLMPRLKYAFG